LIYIKFIGKNHGRCDMGKYYEQGTTYMEMKSIGRKNIGNRLRFLRKAYGDKQKDVAELCDVTDSYISKIELGKSDIKASMIPLLADRYDVFAETFFNEDGIIPEELVKKIIREFELEEYEPQVIKYANTLTDRAVERGNGRVLAEMMYVILKLCAEESHPLEYMERGAQRVKEGTIRDEIKGKLE